MNNPTDRKWPIRTCEDPRYADKEALGRLASSTRDTFVNRGYMMCKPLCFHGLNRPIPADESRITSLAIAPNRRVFGATSGERSHIFGYLRMPAEDVVVDFAVIEGAAEIRNSLVAWSATTVFAGTGPAPGRIIRCDISPGWGDCIQEWGHYPGKLTEVAIPSPEEAIACLVGDKENNCLYGLTSETGTLFRIEVDGGVLEIVGKVDSLQHFSKTLLPAGGGLFYGAGAGGRLFVYNTHTRSIEHLDTKLPCSAGCAMYSRVGAWAYDHITDTIYGGTESGIFFSYDCENDVMRSLGRPTAEQRISAVAVGGDGIVYGFSGDTGSMGHMFMYDPQTGSLDDLGIPLATTEIRRYGYEFEAAATGPDGEIYLGEADRGGCLFVYFPPVTRKISAQYDSA